MQRLLDLIAAAVRTHPGRVVAGVLALTVVMGALATQLEIEADIAEFAPRGVGSAVALDELREMGALGRGAVVIVDAGTSGDVTAPDGIRLAERIHEALATSDRVAADLAPDSLVAPAISSYATPVIVALETLGARAAELTDEDLEEIAAVAYEEGLVDDLRPLFSDDIDTGALSSRAGLVNVELSSALDRQEAIDAELAVRDIVRERVAEADHGEFEVLVYSEGILSADLDDALLREVPLLVVLSLLVIVVVLSAAFRRPGDVVLALVALGVTLVWMAGSIALLGPRFLGVTGKFTQIAIAVPVMLVGLGVDYAIHLTGRYREELRCGRSPADAAAVPVRTVGRALVLVTITTMVGFLANIVSPIPPIVDFAVFMAVGIVCACVAVGLLVPSARCLIDRRRGEAGGSEVPIAGSPGPLSRAMAASAAVAARRPVPVLALVGIVTLAGVFAGTRLDTTFNQDEFIPDDTEVATVLDRMDDLFGGEVRERTLVLVEADLADPDVANAVLRVGERLGGVDDVVTTEDGAAVRSPAHLVASLEAAKGLAERVEGDLDEVLDALAAAGWTGEAFGPDADMEQVWQLVDQAVPGRLDELSADDRGSFAISVRTLAGEDVSPLLDEVGVAVAPLAELGEVTVTGLQVVIAETLDALVDAQLQKILFSAGAAMAVLVAYFWFVGRRPGLGAVTMLPTLVAVPAVLGGMWVVGLSFNALTATVAAVAIGFGVDYGIHISNRFLEERDRHPDAASSLRETVTHTGTALVASATTTAGAFGVLFVFSDLAPLQQFGAVTAMTMVLALLATLFAQSSALTLWDRWHRRREGGRGDGLS